MKWDVKLWERSPRKLYMILAACLAAGCIGWIAFQQVIFIIIGFAAIAIATAEFWVPQKYKIDEDGASSRNGFAVTSISWADVKRVTQDGDGVRLSPLEKDGALAPFRGVYLRFCANRQEVIQAIEERWGPVV
jgi:hypothetical protein